MLHHTAQFSFQNKKKLKMNNLAFGCYIYITHKYVNTIWKIKVLSTINFDYS